jgi:hypothetical protein
MITWIIHYIKHCQTPDQHPCICAPGEEHSLMVLMACMALYGCSSRDTQHTTTTTYAKHIEALT